MSKNKKQAMSAALIEAVLSSVEERYPFEIESARDLIEKGYITDMDSVVDMADYPYGETYGPGGIIYDSGFCWR